MLVLTRRIGETIRIGDDIRITVHDKLRFHVTIGVSLPQDAELSIEGARLRTEKHSGEKRFHLIPLLTGERFRVDDIEVMVGFDVTQTAGKQVRIGVAAPKSVPVHREEVYLRDRRPISARAPLGWFGRWLEQLRAQALGQTGRV